MYIRHSINMKSKTILPFTLILFLLLACSLKAQHRGDNLSFQGLSFGSESGVKALAMGGAYTSVSGDLSSLFWNPAGLADINKMQFSLSGNYYSQSWQENQEYRPNRFFVTLPFYLEGLYVPDPANNGQYDYLLAQNPNYSVELPVTGLDKFSKEAADWTQSKNSFIFNNFAAAIPFNLGQEKFVAAAAFNQKPLLDFDRNDTYLSPHPGYDYYGFVGRVDGQDTARIKWFNYLRQKNGTLNNATAAIAYSPVEYLNLGLGLGYIWGSTDDLQYLKQIGRFDLVRENRFMFSYVDNYLETRGTSKYDAMNLNLSAILKTEHFRAGVRLDLPYTIKRKWDYVNSNVNPSGSSAKSIQGTDELKVPASYTIGISFHPVERFMIAFDYRNAPFSKAEFNLASNDTTYRQWPDMSSLSFGAEYKLFKFMTILGGYRTIAQPFIPDGAALQESGPKAESYNMGLSLSLFFGRIDMAYEIRRLKYYDTYFSNTNYSMETFNNLVIGYTFTF